MTGPIAIDNAYSRVLLEARARGFALNREGQALVEAAFRDAIRALTRDIATSESPLTRTRAEQLRRELLAVLQILERRVARATGRQVSLTVTDLVDIHAKANVRLAERFAPDAASAIAGRFDRVAARAAAVLAARRGNAATFRTLVHRHVEDAAPALDRLLVSSVARGVSSRRLARDIATLLRARDPVLGDYGLEPRDVAGMRTLRSDAMRIAVSETNNALREANAQALAASPIVRAAKWQLSGRHHGLEGSPDICDVLAEWDAYGFGAGMYPPDKWPLAGHPLCGCSQGGPVLFVPPSEWGKPKPPSPALAIDLATEEFHPDWEETWTPRYQETIRAQLEVSIGGPARRRGGGRRRAA